MRLNRDFLAGFATQHRWGNSFAVTWVALMPILICAVLLFAPVPVVFGQVIELPEEVAPEPINDNDAVQILNEGKLAEFPPPASPEIPFFTYTIVASRDGHAHEGSIVGGSPFSSTTNNKTTTVKVVIVPVVLNFNFGGGVVFTQSPTAADPGCLGAGKTALGLTQASPLFHSVSFTMNGVNVGSTTYPDAFQRGEFFTKIGPNYHLAFSVTTLAAQTVTLAASDTSPAHASVFQFSGQCGNNTGNTNIPGGLGIVDINTFDPIARALISKLNLNASEFPLFVFYDSVLSVGDSANLNNCCVGGYHNSESGAVTNPGQTYGVSDFEGNRVLSGFVDTTVMTHEVGEWINDPSTNNLVPAWGHIGQVSGCQDNLEVGDPLSGTFFPSKTLNGFTYHLQELAFFSWFYGKPSIGAGGLFSDNKTFKTDAGALCH
jgi:hypothetical protein